MNFVEILEITYVILGLIKMIKVAWSQKGEKSYCWMCAVFRFPRWFRSIVEAQKEKTLSTAYTYWSAQLFDLNLAKRFQNKKTALFSTVIPNKISTRSTRSTLSQLWSGKMQTGYNSKCMQLHYWRHLCLRCYKHNNLTPIIYLIVDKIRGIMSFATCATK